MNIQEMRDLTEAELQKSLEATRKELFEMRFKKALHQLDNPASLRQTKHRVAQLKTVLREKSQPTATAGGENSSNA